MTKDIQSPHADLPSYQPPKPLAPSLPEGLARERKPPYDRDTGYREEQKGGRSEAPQRK